PSSSIPSCSPSPLTPSCPGSTAGSARTVGAVAGPTLRRPKAPTGPLRQAHRRKPRPARQRRDVALHRQGRDRLPDFPWLALPARLGGPGLTDFPAPRVGDRASVPLTAVREAEIGLFLV